MNGHDLEKLLVEKLPALRAWTKENEKRGILVKAVIDEVLTEHTTLCPMLFKDVFESIGNSAD